MEPVLPISIVKFVIKETEKDNTHRAMDGRVCFYRWSFVDRVKPQRSATWFMEPLRGTSKAMWCVKLLLMPVSSCQVNCRSLFVWC